MTKEKDIYHTIILGGGAAGLMCALQAGQRGKRVLLIEHNDVVGEKIRISGGGRCNFTNLYADPKCYYSKNPRFCYSALARYAPADIIAYVDQHKIAYHEKTLGQLFCDGSAQQIIDALTRDCEAAGVTILTNCMVDGVQKEEHFEVETTLGEFSSTTLVVATGGLSIPKLGATDIGYSLADHFGLNIIPCDPGLVPLKLTADNLETLGDLSGISFPARVSIGKTSFDEDVLITHRGLSGPAILQISSYLEDHTEITINLFPDMPLEEELFQRKNNHPQSTPKQFLNEHLSLRFARRLCEHHQWSVPFGEMSDKRIRVMARSLQQWRLPIESTEGYAKAEVTRGGVDTKELSPKTMEARKVPGLYFIGEVVDVTGWLGGYNFQWAWASAYAAGQSV